MENNCDEKMDEFEEKAWNDFVYGHPKMQIAQDCLENVSPAYV